MHNHRGKSMDGLLQKNRYKNEKLVLLKQKMSALKDLIKKCEDAAKAVIKAKGLWDQLQQEIL